MKQVECEAESLRQKLLAAMSKKVFVACALAGDAARNIKAANIDSRSAGSREVKKRAVAEEWIIAFQPIAIERIEPATEDVRKFAIAPRITVPRWIFQLPPIRSPDRIVFCARLGFWLPLLRNQVPPADLTIRRQFRRPASAGNGCDFAI